MRRTLAAVLVAVALAGCGGGSSSCPSGTHCPAQLANTKLTVLAASSLTDVFPRIGAEFSRSHPGVTFGFSFAGTDQLAAQIQQGAPADVFAGASTKYGDQLVAAHDIAPYRLFCTNRLVLITPSSNPGGIASLRDLATNPVKLVIGSDAVPVGSYTRTVLSNLDAVYGSGYSAKVLSHVVSDEDSVTSIVAKVVSGEADAGFVYVTDALTAGSKVRTISLPASAQAVASYPISAVAASDHAAAAREFVDFVLSPLAQRLLRQAGFGAPPAS